MWRTGDGKSRSWSRPQRLWSRIHKSEEEAVHGLPTVNHDYPEYRGIHTWLPFGVRGKKKDSVVIVGPHPPRRESDESYLNTKPSPPLPPRSERHWFCIWWLEILGILFSIGCTAAIIGVLRTIDGRPLHTWRLLGIADQLTPNALVSVLSTLGKITLLFSVAQGLGQLKWRYFEQRPRRLTDMQIFDEATRGPTGALTLLWKLHFHADAALLGALIIILSLAVDVVVQQVLTYPTATVVAQNATATVRYAKGYSGDLSVYSTLAPQPIYNAMAASIKRGIYGFNAENTMDVFCASGKCTWAPFETLGICNTCKDISDETQIACAHKDNVLHDYGNDLMGLVGRGNAGPETMTCNYTTPNGRKSRVAWSRMPNGIVQPDWDLVNLNGSIDFASYVDGEGLSTVPMNGAILNYTSIGIDPNRTAWQESQGQFSKIKPKAYFCQWKWCAQRYSQLRQENGSITGLNYTEQPLKWECTSRPHYVSNCIGVHQDDTWPSKYRSSDLPNSTVSGNLGSVINAENVYVLNVAAIGKIASYLYDNLNKIMANGSANADLKLDDLRAFTVANNGSIPTTVENIVASFNKMLRELENESFVAHGTAWTAVTLVAVNWPLLVYPAVLPFLGMLFLLATIIHSRKTLPWKSSLLAVLYHGLDRYDSLGGLHGDYNDAMEQAGKRTYVQLRSFREGNKRLIESDATRP